MRPTLSIIVLTLGVLSAPASAADWYKIGTAGTTDWYLDTESLRGDGENINVWVKYDFTKQNIRIKCSERKMKILSIYEYNAAGEVQDSHTYPDYGDSSMSVPPPESVADRVVSLVCS